MTSHTNGEKVRVITNWTDPLTVVPDCHDGRVIESPILRDFLRALGVRICSDCDRYIGIVGRSRWRQRP